MTDFFEAPPRPPEPEFVEPPQQPWWGPPINVLGASLALDLLLARSEDAAVSLERFAAYPSGFGFSLMIRGRTEQSGWQFDESLSGPWRHRPDRADLQSERLRFGIQFADGSKATNLYLTHAEPGDTPAAPVLQERGGGGGGRRWDQDYWVWPLPPPGPRAFVTEWPSQQIPLTRVEIDAELILEAVSRAQVLWEEREPGPSTGS